MYDVAEFELVFKAVYDALGTGFMWDEQAARNVLNDREMRGCSPRDIRLAVIAAARTVGPSCIKQVKENRENWRDRYAYYYKINLPIAGFKHGVFVEIRFTSDKDDDPEFPEATLVGAHPEKK